MRILVLTAVLLLASCQTVKPLAKPAQVIEMPVKVYVPIPDELTNPCPIAHGPLSQSPIVARDRKAALETCNVQLDAIRKIQGQAKP